MSRKRSHPSGSVEVIDITKDDSKSSKKINGKKKVGDGLKKKGEEGDNNDDVNISEISKPDVVAGQPLVSFEDTTEITVIDGTLIYIFMYIMYICLYI
jgi:hypothetical protein